MSTELQAVQSVQAAPRPLVCVGALVRGPTGYLIVQTTKWRGSWGVPGGKVEYGETLAEAVQREFLEETGLVIDQVRYAQTQEVVQSAEFGKDAHMLLCDFWAETSGQSVTPNSEIVQWAWVSLAQAMEYPLNSYTRTLVELTLQHSQPPAGPA